ncbi:MAG TPA: hypothetical protein VKB93_26775 [Thermoanaerobaculia bacterium]|nr:hypothetical protein [Thermoanaerobaculia bacterium]
MKHVLCCIAVLVALNAGADTALRVVPVSTGAPVPFRCGDRCKFRADLVPATPLRLRIFRGTKAELINTGVDARYVNNVTGCVEYFSTIIRAPFPRRPQNVLDLRFYFRTSWLNGNRDGQFVFVVERDDQPNGPQLEEHPPTLRLPARLVGQYFRAGVDVTVKAPTFATAAAPATRSRARNGHETAAMMADDGGSSGGETATAMVAVRTTPTTAAGNDCLTVQFDQQPVTIQHRADEKKLRRKDPLQLADQRR